MLLVHVVYIHQDYTVHEGAESKNGAITKQD